MSGVYSTHLYTSRAISVIDRFAARRRSGAADAPKALFLYLAYQAIHSPDEVPMSYQERFNASIPATPDHDPVGGSTGGHRRIVAGMVACLDEGIGNVTAAVEAAGMRETTLFIFSTDNGGPAQVAAGLERTQSRASHCRPHPHELSTRAALRASTRIWLPTGRSEA